MRDRKEGNWFGDVLNNLFMRFFPLVVSERERQRVHLHADGHRRRPVQGHRLPALQPRLQAENQGKSLARRCASRPSVLGFESSSVLFFIIFLSFLSVMWSQLLSG